MNRGVICIVALLWPLSAFPASLPEVRSCLDSLELPDQPGDYNHRIAACFEIAKGFELSPNLSARALYQRALVYDLSIQVNGERGTYESIAAEVSAYYRTGLDRSSSEVRGLTTEALADLFDGINARVFFPSLVTSHVPALQRERRVFRELEHRGFGTATKAGKLFHSLLRQSLWLEAGELAADWPSLESPPVLEGKLTSGLNYLSLSLDGHSFSRHSYVPRKGPSIVVSGDCHFALDDFRNLSSDPAIAQVMRDHGFVIGASDNVDTALIDTLRKQFPAFEIHPVVRQGQWFQGGFDTTISPSYNFLLDGKIVYSLPGQASFSPERFCAGLKAIGLSASPTCP
jgi:hypothetical protein